MKYPRIELTEAVERLNRLCTTSGGIIPVYKTILFRSEGGKTQLTACNGNDILSANMSEDIPGANACIPSAMLLNALKKCGGDDIDITIGEDNIVLKSGRKKTQITGHKGDEFISIKKNLGDVAYKIYNPSFPEVIGKAAAVANDKDGDDIRSKVQLYASKDEIHVTAHSGYTGYIHRYTSNTGVLGDISVLVTKVTAEIVSTMKEPEIEIYNGHIIAYSEKFVLQSGVDNTKPIMAVDSIAKLNELKNTIKVNSYEFINAVQSVLVVDQDIRRVNIKVKDDTLAITANDSDNKNRSEAEVNIDNPSNMDLSFYILGPFLLNTVNACNSENVYLFTKDILQFGVYITPAISDVDTYVMGKQNVIS